MSTNTFFNLFPPRVKHRADVAESQQVMSLITRSAAEASVDQRSQQFVQAPPKQHCCSAA